MPEILVHKSLKMDVGLFQICTNNKNLDLGMEFLESDRVWGVRFEFPLIINKDKKVLYANSDT